jgi:hypothetical protein
MAYARIVIGRTANTIASRLVHPGMYEAVGIPGRVGRAAALANPNFQETLRWSARRATSYFTELGLISDPISRGLWRHSHLL